jgi:hypothetical protein
MTQKNAYSIRYGEKSLATKELLNKTAKKISFLQVKLKRLEQCCEDENMDEIFDEMVDEMVDEIGDDSEEKVVELDKELVLMKKRTKSFCQMRDSIWSGPMTDFRDVSKDKNLSKIDSESTYNSTNSEINIRKDLLDDMNYESVFEKISTVGINPTALCTETLIIVLLKMESALNTLLHCQNNIDYSELFYRADFMKIYESNIHEIIKMPDDDVFYLK